MKRKYSIENDNVFSCFPIFFWRTCYACKMDFKLVRGWTVYRELGTISMTRTDRLFVCRSCAPTKKIAYEKGNTLPPLPPKPDPPPAPPKKE